MFLYFSFIFFLLWSHVICNPTPEISAWDRLEVNQKFTLEEKAVKRKTPWSHELRRTYLKYGFKPPAYIEEAIATYDADDFGADHATTAAKPYEGDIEYVVQAQVGNLNLTLNLDTGSADLWVFSTLQPANQRQSRHHVYDPKASGGRPLAGHTWRIQYGDGSGANGQVYLEKVGIGEITYPHQALGAAARVSSSFARDQFIDGLLGLSFSKINAIRPKSQLTWFDNIKPKLAAPVFTCALKRRQVGSYDFGFIDRAKYKGDLNYVDVKGKDGFWDFTTTKFSVGNGPVQNITWDAIADTGTTLWYVPAEVADAYYAKVAGATWKARSGGYTFPCASKLPDITLFIGGKPITVDGINMNMNSISWTTCYGGMQRSDAGPGNQMHIAGDVFLKNLFLVFEHPVDSGARLGFAHQS